MSTDLIYYVPDNFENKTIQIVVQTDTKYFKYNFKFSNTHSFLNCYGRS